MLGGSMCFLENLMWKRMGETKLCLLPSNRLPHEMPLESLQSVLTLEVWKQTTASQQAYPTDAGSATLPPRGGARVPARDPLPRTKP